MFFFFFIGILINQRKCEEIGVDANAGRLHQPATFAEALEEGNAALAKREFAHAVHSFKHAQTIDPTHALGRVMMGVVLVELRDFVQSEQEYIAALKMQPTAAPYMQAMHFNLGICRYKLGQLLDSARKAEAFPKFLEAESSFLESIEAQPNHAESHQHLGILMKLRGKGKEAGEFMQRATELAPANSNLLHQAAKFYHQSGLIEQAVTAYQAVIKLTPASPELRAGLGSLLLQSQRTQAAESELLHAFQLDPQSRSIANNLAIVHHDRPQEMIHYYQLAIAIDPTATDTLFNMAIALLDQKQYAGATAAYKRYLEIQLSMEGAKFWKPQPGEPEFV
jgi:Flp pilus assembly protein TadD